MVGTLFLLRGQLQEGTLHFSICLSRDGGDYQAACRRLRPNFAVASQSIRSPISAWPNGYPENRIRGLRWKKLPRTPARLQDGQCTPYLCPQGIARHQYHKDVLEDASVPNLFRPRRIIESHLPPPSTGSKFLHLPNSWSLPSGPVGFLIWFAICQSPRTQFALQPTTAMPCPGQWPQLKLVADDSGSLSLSLECRDWIPSTSESSDNGFQMSARASQTSKRAASV